MISRRALLGVLAAASALPARAGVRPEGEAVPFSRDWLVAEAERKASLPYRPMTEVPEDWQALTYDQYRALWFDPREALWAGEDAPFKVDFFHPGLYFPRPVSMHVVEGGQATPLPFSLSHFDRSDQFPDVSDDAGGYSGLRLRAEHDTPGQFTEFAVFQGASYFRAIGSGQTYGLSARGLAVATAEPSGEEFPDFTHFWLERPAPGATETTVHALLDGPSVTGAYTFVIKPGLPCEMEVTATICARRALDHVGLAPLTSMFLFDETNRNRFDDFRSAVHDSQALMIWNGNGERLWRPLANPTALQVSSFVDESPRGFGLVQRGRRFEDYGDLEAKYHARPSLWVTPRGDWGRGVVQLVEIPAEKEIYDNIVAYWRPAGGIPAGGRFDASYGLTWGADAPATADVAPVLRTRMGEGWDKDAAGFLVAVDFGPHAALDEIDGLTKLVRSNTGETTEGVLARNPSTGGLRLTFRFTPDGDRPAELRAQLLRDGARVSDVFLYRWTAA